jgi:hypothetical protein
VRLEAPGVMAVVEFFNWRRVRKRPRPRSGLRTLILRAMPGRVRAERDGGKTQGGKPCRRPDVAPMRAQKGCGRAPFPQ